MARTSEFNREMGSYLKQRRISRRTSPFLSARNYFKGLFAKEEEQKPLDIPQDQVEAVLKQSSVKPSGIRNTPLRSAPPRAAAPVAPQQQKQQVKTMGWFSKRKDEDDDYEMSQPASAPVDEDVKEVLKITFKWLKMMDAETVEEIKASPDFDKYKAVLDKYGLIKK